MTISRSGGAHLRATENSTGTSTSADWRVRVSADLASFADGWPTLHDAQHHRAYAFQCRDVLQVWLDTIGKARGVVPVVVRVEAMDGTPVMLLPLCVERVAGVRQLTFMDGGVADYNAPVLFPAAASLDRAGMVRLWHQIVTGIPAFDVVQLTKMPAEVGGQANPLLLLGAWPDQRSAYVLDLHAPPPTLPSGKPFKGIALFHDSDRRRRRLSEIGTLGFKFAETAAERIEYLAAMKRQKRRRYIETRGVDGFQRPGYHAYYDAMTDRLGPSGNVNLCALILDGRPIAVHWGMTTEKHFYYLMPSFEGGDLGKYSLGSLLMENVVDWCRQHDMDTFDLGVGDEPYKLKVASAIVALHAFAAGETVAGKTWLAAVDMRRRLSDGRLGDGWRAIKRRLGRRVATAIEE